jgi:hypothetical protein
MTNAAILACYRESPIVMDELVSGTKWTNIGGLYRLEVQAITPGSEVAYGLQYLYSTLSADPTLSGIAVGGVWRGVADAGVATPFVIISLQSGGIDSLTMTAVRLFSNPLYQVKCVGPASITGSIVAGASAIDALLGRTPSIAYI